MMKLEHTPSEDGLPEDIKDMLDTIRAVKGVPYSNIVGALFSITNVAEAMLHSMQLPVEKQKEMGEIYGNAMYQLLFSFMYYVLRIVHKDFDSFSEEQKKEAAASYIENYLTDVDAILKRQTGL